MAKTKPLAPKYGKLTVLSRGQDYTALCKCDCGSDPIRVRIDHLKSGNTKSCGCLRVEAGRRIGSSNGVRTAK